MLESKKVEEKAPKQIMIKMKNALSKRDLIFNEIEVSKDAEGKDVSKKITRKIGPGKEFECPEGIAMELKKKYSDKVVILKK